MKKTGNIVLLTGGSAGIGSATAQYLMKQGYTVYAASRRGSENIDDNTSGGKIIGLCADVTIPESLENAVSRIMEEQGELSAVICNAGNGIAGSVEDTSLEEARYQMETNFFGVLNTIKACLPIFREQNHGKIIAISSVAAVAPIPFQGFYSASKSAIMLLMQSLSMEVKPYNIKCTCILPGDVKTDFTSSRKYTEASTLPSSEYTEAMKAAVQTMEKDEQNGMMPIVIAKAIAKVLKKENPKPVVVPNITYKTLCLIMKLVPTSLKIWVISKMYG
ncbi:MAG: SDR family oxidoreductase [Paludibacteraceae bacterium]|nr:SDR family oxidoreductase [Paludibacteraceae bacterium]MBR6686937.1 SDR family oxidoreductase [Paludibacteraceae bacterium]